MHGGATEPDSIPLTRLARAAHAVDEHAARKPPVVLRQQQQLYQRSLHRPVAVAIEVETRQLLGESGELLLVLFVGFLAVIIHEVLEARPFNHSSQKGVALWWSDSKRDAAAMDQPVQTRVFPKGALSP